MALGRVTVFGGSGFLGRQIVRRLAGDGALVRIAVRRPERAALLTESGSAGQVTVVHADVWDEAAVAPALAGADAAVRPMYI
jgi:NADH dehydrogenase